jgi:hypothetical protein
MDCNVELQKDLAPQVVQVVFQPSYMVQTVQMNAPLTS